MKHTTKTILCLLSLVLLLSLFGCAANPSPPASEDAAEESPSGQTEASDREPATFSFLTMMPARSTYDLWQTPVGRYLAELTNVELEIEDLVGSDVRQKSALLIAAGEYPDLIYCFDASGDFYTADALIPLNDYMKTAKNLSKCYPESLQALSTQEDGNLYWLSRQATETSVYPSAAFFTSMDLLAQAGYPLITDFYEWQDAIVEYIEANPTYNGQPAHCPLPSPPRHIVPPAYNMEPSRFLAGLPQRRPNRRGSGNL